MFSPDGPGVAVRLRRCAIHQGAVFGLDHRDPIHARASTWPAAWTSDKTSGRYGMTTKNLSLRSPADKVEDLVYFARMLAKIRSHARGELPEDFVSNLGKGFDGRCVRFLHVTYEDVVARVEQGGTDEEILDWA